MKIIVLDGHTLNPGDLSWDEIASLGELTVYDRTPAERIIERIGDAEAIYVNKVPITADTIARCKNLRFIGVLATGYNVVDTQAAGKAGIPVTNIPDYGTAAVGQFAIALLLELCHQIGSHSASVLAGDWSQKPDFCYWNTPQIELDGKTMGIIGCGRIGRTTGRIAQALGMKVLAFTPHPDSSLVSETWQYARDLDELLANSDVISLHCPLFPSTRGIINKDTIAKMKDGVLIINNSRGPLVVERDLREALDSGKVAGAAVDVAETEPIPAGSPLLGAKNIIITPHISWASIEARARLMHIAAENLRAFLREEPQNVVNQTQLFRTE